MFLTNERKNHYWSALRLNCNGEQLKSFHNCFSQQTNHGGYKYRIFLPSYLRHPIRDDSDDGVPSSRRHTSRPSNHPNSHPNNRDNSHPKHNKVKTSPIPSPIRNHKSCNANPTLSGW